MASVLAKKMAFGLAALLCLTLLVSPVRAADQAGAARRAVEQIQREITKRFPDVPELKPEHLTPEVLSKVVLVDVRSPEEMKISMLPGAITFEQLKKNFEALSKKVIVAYCTTGFRSAKLVRSLKLYGIQAFSLSGGILAWVQDGRKIYDAKGETKKVHVYGDDWNILPPGYEAVH